MNRVELEGGVIKDADLGNYNWMRFTVAVDEARWNNDLREKEVATTFVSVEWQVPGVMADEHMLYKGDAVHVLGRLTQFRREGEKESHTRVRALTVTVTRRGRDGMAALTGGRRHADEPTEEPPF